MLFRSSIHLRLHSRKLDLRVVPLGVLKAQNFRPIKMIKKKRMKKKWNKSEIPVFRNAAYKQNL